MTATRIQREFLYFRARNRAGTGAMAGGRRGAGQSVDARQRIAECSASKGRGVHHELERDRFVARYARRARARLVCWRLLQRPG